MSAADVAAVVGEANHVVELRPQELTQVGVVGLRIAFHQVSDVTAEGIEGHDQRGACSRVEVFRFAVFGLLGIEGQ